MERKIDYTDNLLEVGEGELGPVYIYDVMIDSLKDGLARSSIILLQLDSLTQYAGGYKLTKRMTSISNILKDLDQTLHNGNPSYYTIPHNPDEVAQLLLLYENMGGNEVEYRIDCDYRCLRLMVEMNLYDSEGTERELSDIIVYARRFSPDAAATTAGNTPQFIVMMQYIVRGQMVSFVISLPIIGILIMIVSGGVRIGLISLIPNITPALVVGRLTGRLGYPSGIMTVTIMPIALGLAVDNAIHLTNHNHLEFDRKGNYGNTILRSSHTIGTPVVLTGIVVCTNFAVYTTSERLSPVYMGILPVTGVLSTLLVDLSVTPILIRKFYLFGEEMNTIERPEE